jgi:hypothetical protein
MPPVKFFESLDLDPIGLFLDRHQLSPGRSSLSGLDETHVEKTGGFSQIMDYRPIGDSSHRPVNMMKDSFFKIALDFSLSLIHIIFVRVHLIVPSSEDNTLKKTITAELN